MSNQGWTVLIFILLVIVIAVAFVIYKLAAGRADRRREYQNQQKNILVQNGIDVKKQMLGSGKGEYFSGNLREYDTNYINGPRYSTWKISFQDMDTGRIFQYRFSRQMTIGRMLPTEKEEVCLVLEGDGKVSKRHCMIYEGEGTLCLADQNSKNHTYVNGKKADSPVFLHTGDVIKAGETRLKGEFGR